MSESPIEQPLLELESMIGFNGSVPCGLKVHPDRQHLIYPVGCTVVIEDLNTKKQEFLSGHTNNVTCIAISKSGRYIASGQVTFSGFKADVIVWDYEKRQMVQRLSLHKVKVEAVAFSPNDKYLASLGGEDDGCVVVWKINPQGGDGTSCEAICGSPAQVKSAGQTHTLVYANQNDDVFVTAGNDTLRVWTLDLANRKIKPEAVNMGQLKRVIKCMVVTEKDEYVYCGTTTGDILAVNMASKNMVSLSQEKEKCGRGVTALALLGNGDVLVGGGDGTVTVFQGLSDKAKKCKEPKMKRCSGKQAKVDGAVVSLGLRGEGHQFFVGTADSNIYRFNYGEFSMHLQSTCHDAEITDIAFPARCSEIFLTSSFQQVRIWSPDSEKELLRITVPNMTCNAVEVAIDGQSIITGWDDGRIRAFYPESGKPMYTIEDAHRGGVTALALYSDCRHIVSGGKQGDVRVWCIGEPMYMGPNKAPKYTVRLESALQEHKASVTCIRVSASNGECVSSSIDGSCIIWDLKSCCRKQMIRVNTLFRNVCYHPAENQIITTGTDRKISYFETFNASTIRELLGSVSGSINSLDISHDGMYVVSGGDDKLVKVWKYDEGEVTHIGIGHSASINQVKISPNMRYILSVSKDGGVLRWKFPHAC